MQKQIDGKSKQAELSLRTKYSPQGPFPVAELRRDRVLEDDGEEDDSKQVPATSHTKPYLHGLSGERQLTRRKW